MKKKFLLAFAATAVIGLAAYSFQPKNEEVTLSEMAMENAEALAYINPECPNGCLITRGSCYCYGEHNYEEARW